MTGHLPRGTASARILLEAVLDRGLDSTACLRDTGLTPRQLSDPTQEIAGSQEARLIENIVAGLGDDPAVPLDAGCRYSLPAFGMFGLAIMSATTPREMIELSLRYQELSVTLARARLVRSADTNLTFIELDTSELADAVQAFVVDHCMAVVWSHTCALDGVPTRATVELRRSRPSNLTAYRDLYGFDPAFDASRDRIGFPDAFLDQRRLQVDPDALAQCAAQCEAVIERRRAIVGMSGMVRERFERAAFSWPSMDDVAADLHVSVRTLGRHLATEGTSFREIDNAARQARAERLLRGTHEPLDRIADALGYGSSSAFVRAFKRSHTVPPGTWRQARPR